jgi:TPR repeat protein
LSSDDAAANQQSSGQAGNAKGPTHTTAELWKPHPPNDDCLICFVPLPFTEVEQAYRVCCGKTICAACMAETGRAARIINAKRAEKKLPPLEPTCPFCRSASIASESQYKERIRKGDVKAAHSLAYKYRNGDARTNISKDETKSLELLHHAADDLDSSMAKKTLGRMYSYGIFGAQEDKMKGRKYLEDAVQMGNVSARYFLGRIEAEEKNIDLAIRHWKLAAAAGDEYSTKQLLTCFSKGTLAKAELEEALRAHQVACDAVNSGERESDGNYMLQRRQGMTLCSLAF